jgi:hypothetical protein
MEVHAHTHTARKKWTHYFWEFLMLFLAVFCGFLAEIQLEHKIEKDRAKILAKNLYEEIYADSVAVQKIIDNRDLKEKESSYFINYVKDSNLALPPSRFFSATTISLVLSNWVQFEPNDGVLNQLRNSGELRYFKNMDIQAAIGNLGVKIASLRNRNEQEYRYLEDNIRPFLLKHFDFRWLQEFTSNGTLAIPEAIRQNLPVRQPAKILNLTAFSRQEAENMASYYLLMLRSTRLSQYKQYTQANHKLLELLRTKYKLK